MLVSLLNSHPEIKCRGEMFAAIPMNQDSRDPKPPDVHVRKFRETYYYRRINLFPGHLEHPTDNQTVAQLESWFETDPMIRGFKLKHPSQFGLYPEIAKWLLDQQDLKVIVLRRQNYLRRAISLFNMQRLQKETRLSNSRDSGEFGPLWIDVDETVRLIRYYQTSQISFDQISDRFANTYQVDYQQLLDEATSDQTLNEVQQFLGVKTLAPLKSRTKKITPSNLKNAIENFDALSAALRKEGLEFLLE